MVWFPAQGFTYHWGRNASQECSAALRRAKKCFTTWGLFISVMSHVKLIAETRVNIWHKNMKSTEFLEIFRGNHIKNIPQEMKNGFSLRQQQLQVIMYYILWVFYEFTCRQDKCTPKKRTILSFIFNSIRYEDFPYATILKRLLSNSSGVPQSISYH